MKKNGFIATSIMYSFFIVFTLMSLLVLATYLHYRILNNSLNSSIKNELNMKIKSSYARLTNLAINGGFDETDPWTTSNAGISDKFAFSAPKSMAMYKNTSANSYFKKNIDVSSLEKDGKNHKVYFRFRVFKAGSMLATSGKSGNDACIVINDADKCISRSNEDIFIDGRPNADYEWKIYSHIFDIKFDEGNLDSNNKNWVINFFINNITTSGVIYIDDVMLIDINSVYGNDDLADLTKEEAQAIDDSVKTYLDTYVDYFDGDYVLPKCVRVNKELVCK